MGEKYTSCTICGKQIAYKTKKPIKCESCKKPKKKKTTGRRRRFPSNKGTQGERLLFHILNKILSDYEYINHGYYSFLPSPKGSPMQIDRYYPELKLGYEFDGKQHDEFSKWIHGSVKNFEYQKKCDILKDELCKKQGIKLIRVSYKEKLTDNLIMEKIKEVDPKLYKNIIDKGK